MRKILIPNGNGPNQTDLCQWRKRRAKRTFKEATASLPGRNENGDDVKANQVEDKEAAILVQDDFHSKILQLRERSGAVRAMRDVEIEHSLTALRLLWSYSSEEQLHFFKENLPNLSIVKNEENGQCEVKWNEREINLSINRGNEIDVNASLLCRFSMVHPNCFNMPLFGGIDLPSEEKTKSLFSADNNLQVRDFLMEGLPVYQMLEMYDGLQTPGAYSFFTS